MWNYLLYTTNLPENSHLPKCSRKSLKSIFDFHFPENRLGLGIISNDFGSLSYSDSNFIPRGRNRKIPEFNLYILHDFLSKCVWRDAIWSVPLFKNYLGLDDANFDFHYEDEVSLRYGCGITLRGQMWYFGGGFEYTRQVSSKAILQIQIIYS